MNNQEFWQWCEHWHEAKTPQALSPLVMGILNVTPDSFSDGGAFMAVDQALNQARSMITDGVDIIDIGGESTRPGALPVTSEEEIDRVLPVIQAIRRESDIALSIDTSNPDLMRPAVAEGAGLINDIRALSKDRALETVKDLQIPVCLMHMRGVPATMQEDLDSRSSVMTDVHSFFLNQIQRCEAQGIPKKFVLLDPGFGFGKSVDENLTIINQFAEFKRYRQPMVLGVSRKSTIGQVLNKSVDKRLIGGLALEIMALMQGLNIIRTHEIQATKEALQMVLTVQKRGLQHNEPM